MPKQPPKPGQKKDKTEERWVTWDDLDAGVHLKAGHPVILFLGGHPTPGATTTLASIGGITTQPGDEPEATTTDGGSPGGGTSDGPGSTTTQPPGDTTSGPPATTSNGGDEPAATTTRGSYQPPNTTSNGGGTTPATTTTGGSHDATGPDSPGASTTSPPRDSTSSPSTTTTQYAGPGTSTTQRGGPGTTTTQHAGPGTTTTSAAAPGTTTTRSAGPATTTTHAASPGTTTTHAGGPGTTTTHRGAAGSTTTHPPSTTTIKKGKRYKLDADHFDNAKAFPKPEQKAFDTYKKVSQAVAADSSIQLLILGHTDTKASDSYNLQLSDERAAAVKAFLLQDPSVWMPYYTNSDSQKKWGLLEDQYMLSALPDSGDGVVENKADAYYKRAPSGRVNADFTAALKKFQTDAGEPATGTVSDATRRKLIAAYMGLEGTSVPSSTSIDSVGCSFRNQAEDPPTGMNVDSPTNRRTEIYAFYGPVTPPASAWNRADKTTAAPTYAAWRANTEDDSI